MSILTFYPTNSLIEEGKLSSSSTSKQSALDNLVLLEAFCAHRSLHDVISDANKLKLGLSLQTTFEEPPYQRFSQL